MKSKSVARNGRLSEEVNKSGIDFGFLAQQNQSRCKKVSELRLMS